MQYVVVYGAEVVGPFDSVEDARAAQAAADPKDARADAVRPLLAPRASAMRDCTVCAGRPGNQNCRYCRGRGVLPRRMRKAP